MQDTNTGTFGDLLSEGREDIEFGTVSEILKVSSSIQSESATYAEDIESLAHFGVFWRRKTHLFGVFRPLKSDGALLEV